MGFLHKRGLEPGFACVGVHPDGVSVCAVRRDNSSVASVTACEFRTWRHGEPLEDVVSRVVGDFNLQRRHCVTVLDPSDYRLLATQAPDVPEEELTEALRWQIKDLLDFKVGDATLDVFPFPAADGQADPRQRYVVAAHNQALRRRIKLMEDAGANLEVVDIPEMALRNIASLIPDNDNGVAFLFMNPAYGLLTLSKGNALYVSRQLNVGLDALCAAEERGVLLDSVVTEIQRSLDFFSSHFRHGVIDRLILTPLPPALPDLDEFFSERLGVESRVVHLQSLLDWRVEVDDALVLKCMTTIGASLRQTH